MILYIVIPCYKEEEVLASTATQVGAKMKELIEKKKISPKSRVAFIDDGSTDRTWNIIEQLHKEDALFIGTKLSRNCGHQNALLAGLHTYSDVADGIISMDADLQDDVNLIENFVDKATEGYDIVYGVRNNRDSDTFFKKWSAQCYYKLMRLLGADIVYNHADCRYMSKRAVEALLEYQEVNLFLRGLVPMVGYPSTTIYYKRNPRLAGESKYPLRKMISFGFDGITSLSIKPINLIFDLGFGCCFISILLLIYSLVRHFQGETVTGWTSLMVSVWALGGLQLISIGLIGKYLGKIYLETKRRPRFFIEKQL